VKRSPGRVLIVVLVAVVVVGAVGFWRWERQAPPALGAHAADVYRLVDTTGGRSVPPMPTAKVREPDGTDVYLTLAGRDADDPAGATGILVSRTVAYSGSRLYTVHAGSHLRALGLDITVLHVWNEPRRVNCAVDLKADPV
jgi:hypothetical protein